jgi:uncharacterized membrane protein YraQ (UPF0718 family)
MKHILKVLLIFVLGLIVGGGIAGFFVNKFYENRSAQLYALELGKDAMFARLLREGEAEIVSKAYENNLSEQVLQVQKNDELRNQFATRLALTAAKKFYVCTKTEIPPEIAEIMNKLPESACNGIDKVKPSE